MANLVPIKKEQHQNIKVANARDLSHVEQQHIAPVTAREYAQASTSYPIMFVKDPDSDRYRSVIMLGIESGENLYYSKERWNALYVPQSIGMVPFGLGLDPEKERTLTSCIDLDSPFVGEDKEIALYDEKGEETDFLKNIHESLGRYYENEVATEKFIKEMMDNDLMQELELTVNYADGERKRLVGVYSINEQKMMSLSDEKALDFYKRGLFIPMHAMLGSMGQINRLVQLHNERSEKKVAGVQILPAEQAKQEK